MVEIDPSATGTWLAELQSESRSIELQAAEMSGKLKHLTNIIHSLSPTHLCTDKVHKNSMALASLTITTAAYQGRNSCSQAQTNIYGLSTDSTHSSADQTCLDNTVLTKVNSEAIDNVSKCGDVVETMEKNLVALGRRLDESEL